MIKRKTIETIKEYDESGKLTRETITETIEDDNNQYTPYYPYNPYTPTTPGTPSSPYYYTPTTPGTPSSPYYYNTDITCNCPNNTHTTC